MSEMQETRKRGTRERLTFELWGYSVGLFGRMERLVNIGLLMVMLTAIAVVAIVAGGHVGDAVGLWDFSTTGSAECFRAGDRVICD